MVLVCHVICEFDHQYKFPANSCGHRHFGGRNMIFLIYNVISQNHMISFMRFYNWEPHKLSHHLVKFDDLRHSGSIYIIDLVCHVISENCVMKVLCDFTGESPLW